MNIFDRLRGAQPAKQPPKRPRGGSGRTHVNGFIEVDEPNTRLAWPRGLEVFDEMWRTDPDVRKNLWMIINLIVGATWSVEPAGGDQATDHDRKVAQDVEWALFANLDGGWKGHLTEALRVGLRSGFVLFEHVWELVDRDGRQMLVPRNLDLRLPRTITEFHQDNGQLTGVRQQLVTGDVDYRIDELIYYRFGIEGDNWEGESLLRPVYKPWKLKDAAERVDAIRIERQALGVPLVYPPDDASSEQLDDMEEILAAIRAGEQSFIMMPGPKAEDLTDEAASKGWRFEIVGVGEGDSTDVKPSLDYHSDKIAAALIAEFMRLGQGSAPGGARATADVQVGPFHAAVEALSSVVEGVINTQLVRRIVDLNYQVDDYPKVVMSLVDETSLEQLSTYVAQLVEKGALNPDDQLEDWLRDRADLPPADPEERQARKDAKEEARKALAAGPPPVGPAPPAAPRSEPEPKPTPTPAPPAAKDEEEPEKWGRPLRWWEQLIDLEQIDNTVRGARERFEIAAGPAARDLVRTMVDAAEAGKPQPAVAGKLEQAVLTELTRIYDTGRQTVKDEIARQRPGVPATEDKRESVRQLKRRAKLASDSMAGRIWQAINRTVLRRPGDTAAAQAAGEAEAGAALRAEAQLHASAALGQGRSDQADDYASIIRGSRYTSILDSNRCQACANADDDVLRMLNDPVRIAHKPPNMECSGGDRCRCIEFFEAKAEDPTQTPAEPARATGAGPADDHFDIVAESQADLDLIHDQVNAIKQVHDLPANLTRVPIVVKPLNGPYGHIRGGYDHVAERWSNLEIALDRAAMAQDPPIVSVVHEIGHLIDMHGFGDGQVAPSRSNEMLGASSMPALAEWREAVFATRAFRDLPPDDAYLRSIIELLARSYEQYIATRSGNQALKAKIAARRAQNAALYWDDDDFQPVAEAFDRVFATRNLRR